MRRRESDLVVAWAVPVLTLLFHLATCAGYGYFRDELYYLANGRHLAFGYVEHPPLIGVIAAAVTATAGSSLLAIRFLPAVAAAATVFMAGAIAREMGAGRYGRLLAQLATMLVPGLLGIFGIFTMNAFDILFWAVLWWIVAGYLRTGDERTWLAFGVVAGLGLQNKISVLFIGAAIPIGLLVAGPRKAFSERWLWVGGAVAAAIFLPHVAWQAANGWPTLEFIRNATAEKNVAFSPAGYLGAQAVNTLPALLVWIAGLAALLAAPSLRRFRALGWAWLVVLAIMLATRSKPYYLVPSFTLLFAAGGVALERLGGSGPARLARVVAAASVVVLGVAASPLAKALLPADAMVAYAAAIGVEAPREEQNELGRLPQHFADMHGWPELAAATAAVFNGLPKADRDRACVFAQNYGQAGAIDLFGPGLGLPPAISGHNSYHLWGPRGCTGEVIVILGGDEEDMAPLFASLRHVATFTCRDCMPYENNKPIWVGRGLRIPMRDLWPRVKRYI
ncbi:MAG TPA: glycosyltransferase family 39 protein [Vicinamibacterales bacterium]|nr:glycosyltransferase family 39 protein [Vicinamibacterales bacterium]